MIFKEEGWLAMTIVTSLKEKFSLSGNALKVIAIIAMTIDHLAWIGIEEYSQAETPVQIILHCMQYPRGL